MPTFLPLVLLMMRKLASKCRLELGKSLLLKIYLFIMAVLGQIVAVCGLFSHGMWDLVSSMRGETQVPALGN